MTEPEKMEIDAREDVEEKKKVVETKKATGYEVPW